MTRPGHLRTLAVDGEPVAVFRLNDGRLCAVDNRCPHEGYPLSQGDLVDGPQGPELVCRWHNWRFSLPDGRCRRGGEDLPTFPVSEKDGEVRVQPRAPPDAEAMHRREQSLQAALREHDTARSSREAARLLRMGRSPARVAALAAAHEARHAPWGSGHGLPVAADMLAWLPLCPGTPALLPLAQALDLCGEAGPWRAPRTWPPPVDPGPDPSVAERTFQRAVEEEDEPRALGLLRGALQRGLPLEELERWLFAAISTHHLSFGHRLIYQVRAFELLRADPGPFAEDILLGHLAGLIGGTREDLLAPWAPLRALLSAVELDALQARPADPEADADALRAALVAGPGGTAAEAMRAALQRGLSPERAADALILAGAERVLRFDPAIEWDDAHQDGWLSVTHILTFASAARQALERWPDPRRLRFLLHGAFFAGRHRPLDGPSPTLRARPGSAAELVEAIEAGRTEEALERALHAPEGMEAALLEFALLDRAGAPIIQAHRLKTLRVGLEERARLLDPRPLLAAVRLLATPLRARWVHQEALEALALIEEGRIPRRRVP